MHSTPLYKDSRQPVAARVDDLLARMSPEEKTGQLQQLDGRTNWNELYDQYQPGSMLNVLDRAAGDVQARALRSRLGIPLLLAIDAIHGHSLKQGATIFPTQLALSCSWNAELAEELARITALEVSYTGAHWTFAPVLCLPRDLRWGRIDETCGEDPRLIADMACAMVRGFQGARMDDPRRVLACAKHFAGYGETQGGRDASEAEHTERKMRTWFLPPFERAVRAGCATFMTGYQVIDGTPCTANAWLLTQVLRDEWGFEGILVTDYDNVGRLQREQMVCPTLEDAAVAALNAGNDMIMHTPGFYQAALDALRKGRISADVLDRAVRRILTLKFAMGLFENPRMPDEDGARTVINCAAHRSAALDAARQSLVLLKNDGVLPLNPSTSKRVAVIGPLADNAFAQLGDWSLGSNPADGAIHPRELTVTLLDGLRARLAGAAELLYERGCSIYAAPDGDTCVTWMPSAFSTDTAGFDAAVAAARSADVVIAAVGDTVSLTGEYRSTATLELMGPQQQLLEALHATGTPLVVVLINSKPLAIPWIAAHAAAIVEAFNPGMLGGTALAELLCGDINPCGKLTISFPVHVGQQPVWYHRVPGTHGIAYADRFLYDALFPFGFGLSYTTFSYANLRLARAALQPGDPLELSVDITNTGARAGVEIAQVYVRDVYTSVTWPDKLLKAYARVALEPGECRTVSFSIAYEDLALVNRANERVVEPGDFEVFAGPSSRARDALKSAFSVCA